MNSEDLLAHADFVRALARSLVIDEHRAADVEQRTWLAALEHPPAKDRNPRSWFARVARNFVVTTYRGEVRRKKYEQDQSLPEKITTPEEVALRKEALRQMSTAVLTLDEPYFSTILLRFYEDLPPKEVAARLGVPVETVKTRIQRALKLLKSEMDEKNDGNRKKWCLALAPIAGLQLTTATAAAATGTATSMVSAKLKIGLVAALFLGTTFTLLQILPESRNVHIPDAARVAKLDVLQDVAEMNSALFDDEDLNTMNLLVGVPVRESLEPSGLSIAGRVTDLVTSAPVTAFDFKLYRFKPGDGWSIPYHETVLDGEGRFSFPLEEGGYYHLAVWANRYQMKRVKRLKIFTEPGRTDLDIKLDPGHTVSGRVIHDESGQPVEGALVGPAVYSDETDLVLLYFTDLKQAGIYDRTDAEGRFSIRGLRDQDDVVASVHPDYAEGHVKTEPGSGEEVTIRLKDGFRISGRVLDDHGRPAKEVLIRVYGEDLPTCRPVMTGPDGRYRTPPLKPGRVYLKAGAPPPELEGHDDFSEEHKVVDVVDQDLTVDFGPTEEYLTWRGCLLGYDGEPLPGSVMRIHSAVYSPHDAYQFKLARYIHCDDAGRFSVTKLLPGRYHLSIHLPREHYLDWGTIAFQTPGVEERDIDLSLSDALSGMVTDSASGSPLTNKRGMVFAFKSSGERKRYSTRIDPEGRFEIRNVVPGSYTLQAMVDGRYSKHIVGIKVEKGKRIADLEIPVVQGGWLHLKFDGFDPEEKASFSLSLAGGESEQNLYKGKFNFVEGGSREKTFPLETGKWTASLSFTNLGYLERRFEIVPNETTEVTVFRHDTESYEGTLSLSGLVAHAHGAPASGIRILIEASSVPGLSRNQRELEARSDDQGRYHIEGLKPGRWIVNAELPSGGWAYFPELWIAADSKDPVSHNLIIPAGVVQGVFHDRESGQPFEEGRPRNWVAKLKDVKRQRYVAGLRGGSQGGLFELEGILQGEYQLDVEAEGYEHYRSAPFSVLTGQAMDFGKVELLPCGVLDLLVLDANGHAVKYFSVTCDGKRRSYDKLTSGRRRYDKLPLGSIKFTIKANGYLEQDITVRMEPARPVEARVVLRLE